MIISSPLCQIYVYALIIMVFACQIQTLLNFIAPYVDIDWGVLRYSTIIESKPNI